MPKKGGQELEPLAVEAARHRGWDCRFEAAGEGWGCLRLHGCSVSRLRASAGAWVDLQRLTTLHGVRGGAGEEAGNATAAAAAAAAAGGGGVATPIAGATPRTLFSIRSAGNLAAMAARAAEPGASGGGGGAGPDGGEGTAQRQPPPSFVATVHGVSLLAGGEPGAAKGGADGGDLPAAAATAAAAGGGGIQVECPAGMLAQQHHFTLRVCCDRTADDGQVVRAELLPAASRPSRSGGSIGATFRVKLGLTAGEERGLQEEW